jgi:hypothetical protein
MNATSPHLHGWKEIAAHLHRSVRCVQRWERNENLRVHRHTHARGDTVYAFLEELDAWQRLDRAAETKSAALTEKKELLNMRNASVGRQIRRARNQIVNESSSEKHVASSTADLQNFAYQLALLFLRAAEDYRPNTAADSRVNHINETSRTRNPSA